MSTATVERPVRVAAEPRARSQATHTGSRGSRGSRWPRRLGTGLLVCGGGMVPWLFVLAVTLPASTRASHWSIAWVGLDALEAIGLAITGWLVRRSDPRRCLTATATATLLIVDAWFDVCTAGSGAALTEAVVMAIGAEVPMAALCAMVACRTLARA